MTDALPRPFLTIAREGAVVIATMNHPDSRNALSEEWQFEEFVTLVRDLTADPGVGCLVLTGAGPAFCAGGNVKQMKGRTGIAAGSGLDIRDRYRSGIQRIPKIMLDLEVPMIAAVNGPAIGAGCDLACMADIRIAGASAKFAESFVKLGIIPGDGGAWLLQRIVGYAKAAELTFTGDLIDAQEALRIGLVSDVVADADLLGRAKALAQRIAANPPRTLRLSKRLLREAQTQRLDTVLDLSAAYQALAHHSEDHAEAIDAFLTKRPGVYSGR